MPEENQTAPEGNQKSDKSPEELMGQVASGDDSLDPSKKVSIVDAMAHESNQEIDLSKNSAPKEQKGFKKLLSKVNIYLVLFILVVVVAVAAYIVMYFMNKKSEDIRIETTKITQETLDQLKTTDAVVGDPKQILTIESNAVITGKVVMRDSLDIAGGLNVGGALSLTTINTAGPGSFQSLKTNDLQAAGNVTIGGMLDVANTISTGQNMSVARDINGGGRLDIAGQAVIGGNLNVNGVISAKGINFDEISITRININGRTPGVSVGSAAGGGGTASISGTDTAATVTINTGGGTSPGILATINFTGTFKSSNPHAVITPNGPGCSNIGYYVTNISASQFSIATSTPAPAGANCKFNYIVIN